MLKVEFQKKFKTEIEAIKRASSKDDFRKSLSALNQLVEQLNLFVTAWDFVSCNFDRKINVFNAVTNNKKFSI